ncbi:MAG TPA: cytochrome c oxidase assembly protein, partial [Methylomirabilota bacterium]|nr:cytochrome c oxidase assembly protein [Methylomirabilota bacterium]
MSGPGAGWGWSLGSLHPEVGLAVLAATGAYAAAHVVRGTALRARHAGPFLGGLLALLAALNGPLHDLGDGYLFSAHMVQHLVLTLLVPPLLLAGTPRWLADALLAPVLARRAGAAVVRTLTHPLVALAVYTVALVAWHLPGPYDAALEAHGWHVVEHVVLLAAAGLAWWPLLSPASRAPALPSAAQLLYVFV